LSLSFRRIALGVVFIGGLAAAYAFGAYSFATDRWPVGLLRNLKRTAAGETPTVTRLDPFGRLLAFPGKVETPCPAQTGRTSVLMAFGGSNAGNYTGQRVVSTTGRAFNYLDGKCYAAASPLLGADQTMGEYWTLLTDRLVSEGLYDDVVISVTSVGSSTVADWAPGGRLAPLVRDAVAAVGARYKPTQVIWDVGEDDAIPRHDPAAFSADYAKIVQSLRDAGVGAPVYLTLATKCMPDDFPWSPDNPIARAESALPAQVAGVSSGVNRDALLTGLDRRDDCHLAATGATKMAEAWLQVLKRAAAKPQGLTSRP
jgi:hypothetical protein